MDSDNDLDQPLGAETTTEGPPRPKTANSRMLSPEAWFEIGRSLGLSRRQLQIVHFVFDDLTEHAIAADLGISAHTVHTHLERLYHKLGVRDRPQLVLRILDEFINLTTSFDNPLPPLCPRHINQMCPVTHGAPVDAPIPR